MSVRYQIKCLIFLGVHLVFGILLMCPALAEEQKCEMEFNDNVVITDAQIHKIKSMAKEEFNGVMNKITIGRIGHFSGMGARISFKDEIIDSNVIERNVIIKFECESTNTQSGVYQTVTDKKFKSWGLTTKIKRVFKLSKGSIHLKVPQNLSYVEVDRILKAIDNKAYGLKKPDRQITIYGMNDTIDMTEIISVEYDEEEDLYDVKTFERRYAGKIYHFEVNEESITLVSVSTWVS